METPFVPLASRFRRWRTSWLARKQQESRAHGEALRAGALGNPADAGEAAGWSFVEALIKGVSIADRAARVGAVLPDILDDPSRGPAARPGWLNGVSHAVLTHLPASDAAAVFGGSYAPLWSQLPGVAPAARIVALQASQEMALPADEEPADTEIDEVEPPAVPASHPDGRAYLRRALAGANHSHTNVTDAHSGEPIPAPDVLILPLSEGSELVIGNHEKLDSTQHLVLIPEAPWSHCPLWSEEVDDGGPITTVCLFTPTDPATGPEELASHLEEWQRTFGNPAHLLTSVWLPEVSSYQVKRYRAALPREVLVRSDDPTRAELDEVYRRVTGADERTGQGVVFPRLASVTRLAPHSL